MICTEEEARKKVCRIGSVSQMIALIAVMQSAALVREMPKLEKDVMEMDLCIASDCMWWVETGRICEKCSGAKTDRGSGHWHADCEHEWQSKGYCGLGGKP
jgi:hypothetical protein